MNADRRLRSLLVVLGLLGVVCCTTTPAEDRAARSATPPTSATAEATATRPTTAPPPSPTPAPRWHPVSLPALMDRQYDGRGLRLGEVLARTSAYTRYFVTYKSDALTISGIMNVPRGRGPFPVLVLNHGYIDPDVYTNGRGLAREQDYLARHGYAVLHTDYRNHAQSDDDPKNEMQLRLGYTVDVINAVLAVKASRLRSLDVERVGLVGRSMGGGITLNALVVKPGLVDAAVVFAPVSSDAGDNFNRWIRGEPERRQLADRIIAAYGTPERNRAFWRNLSARTFFDRVSEPILIHHGTADDTCPIGWSRETFATLRSLGKDARLLTYPEEGHTFFPAWPTSMQRTVAFLDRHLGA